jgi:hypothetical protein
MARNDCPHIRVLLVRSPHGNFTRCKDCGEENAWERTLAQIPESTHVYEPNNTTTKGR